MTFVPTVPNTKWGVDCTMHGPKSVFSRLLTGGLIVIPSSRGGRATLKTSEVGRPEKKKVGRAYCLAAR